MTLPRATARIGTDCFARGRLCERRSRDMAREMMPSECGWTPRLVAMRVSFFIHDATKRIVSWEARIGKRTRVPGALMGLGTEAPHDLVQY